MEFELTESIRAPASVFAMGALTVAFIFMPLLPGAQPILGLRPHEAALLFGAAYASIVFATLAYRRLGHASRVYQLADLVENPMVQAGLLLAVLCSGAANSIYWALYIAQTAYLTKGPRTFRLNVALLILGPLVVALAFASKPDGLSQALLVAGIAGVNLLVFSRLANTHLRLLRAQEDRARLAARLREMDVLAERTRLARDLHDSVAADLNALQWRILRIAQSTPELREEMQAVADRAAASQQHLRQVIRGARASSTNWGDLIASLRRIGADLADQRMCVELDDETSGRIDVLGSQTREAMIATAREGLHNAIRHSRGGLVRMRLTATDDKSLTLVVEDDGIGFVPDEQSHRGGLENLAARAAELGGCFSISSRPGSTRLTCRLPADATMRSGFGAADRTWVT